MRDWAPDPTLDSQTFLREWNRWVQGAYEEIWRTRDEQKRKKWWELW